MSELVWWQNGRYQGAFRGDLEDINLFQGDGFACVVPMNRIIRRLDGQPSIIDLSRPEHHLRASEVTILTDAFLKHLRGRRWSQGDLLEVVKYRGTGRHIRTTVCRWMVDLRKVVQEGKPNIFFCTDTRYGAPGWRYAWYLNPDMNYLLIDSGNHSSP